MSIKIKSWVIKREI